MENRGLRESKEGSCHRTFQLTASHPGFLRALPPLSLAVLSPVSLDLFVCKLVLLSTSLDQLSLGLQMATRVLSPPSHLCGLGVRRRLPPSSQNLSPSVHGTSPRALTGPKYVSMHLSLPGNPSLSIQGLP